MERIAQLIIKHLKSETSPAEEIELQEWIDEKPENQELFNRFNDPEQLRDLLKWTSESKVRILGDLRGELYEKTGVVPMKRASFRRYLYVAAAVLLFGMVGTIGYFLLDKKPVEKTVVKAREFSNDVLAPTGSQAMLILPGGEKINLDNVKSGVVTKQGNVEVTKEGDALVYKIISTDTKINNHTLKTNNRGFMKVLLPDESSVWLNALSSITYPSAFIGKTRNVQIDGEAFFEVAKNKKMPFIVKAGDMSVEVTGTAFAVSAYNDEPVIRTTLVEGSVKLVQGNKEKNLVPGQQGDVTGAGNINIVEDGNFDEAIAFRENRFGFQDTHIEKIMKEVERWYGVSVEFQTKIDRHFSAPLSRNEPLSKLLKWLELTDRVHFKLDGKKLTVLP